MLQPILHHLNSTRIVLASSSPRRKQILENIVIIHHFHTVSYTSNLCMHSTVFVLFHGVLYSFKHLNLKFDTAKSNFEENLDKSSFSSPSDYVRETAKQKTLEVVQRLFSIEESPELIIGADTVVTDGKNIFEKPKDKDHAVEMITSYCGRSHKVLTSVVLITPKSSKVFKGKEPLNEQLDITQFEEISEVFIPELPEEVVRSYVDTGESMDKAGGYGIQAIGGSLISGIQGDYFNVMGFPLHKFCVELRHIYQL
ncbi:putative bifunctional dTTP/UTP pyrophosphatase/methyltransferase protein isoform X3 [Crassostrea virginica]